ncbi:tRNA nucleotidyltransferase (CCA-adding enzyme) [Desulfomicrobium norvegicum]|uniref:tRNA nucleotidyltransferase (CCA-adding enzyme) n=1 Tax=Desulfomicrobium norvegicum (strain DSM 1741 / NCIMB 8310) TaxID=52561 RepID=A0A8G2C3I6_DESNO|nr:CBS domain-containing protein [Desulfomicrobium norvegicum]SFL71813.1 tRNA nucleotidyltransferase (CCA-adding enzyme) [Desulfomicrobium norvegicum]
MTPETPFNTVITCHANADFDALAAMIAVSKLYPGAALVFPGTQESSLKDYFIQSAMYLFNFKSLKDLDLNAVRLLVVVDTRQRSRLAHVEPLFALPDLQIHLYDHHPATDDALDASLDIYEAWGATTSIIVAKLKDKALTVSPDEATIMGLGIFEDTGGFTFKSTTEHDFEAAAWLRTMGMDLDVIRDIMSRELSTEQVAILSELIDSATTHTINGVDIVIAEVVLDTYVGDFALLTHKLMDMENIRVLFAIGHMGDRIQLVARSKVQEVDVGVVCSSFGGGGHAYAASASIKDRTISQVKDELFALLYSLINPQMVVRDFMSSPVVRIKATQSVVQAAEVMIRYGLKALPVVEYGDQVCGIIENSVAEKAVGHGLGDERVTEYMLEDFHFVTEDQDLYQVMEIILGHRQRLVPVLRGQELVGVITRTDLINLMVQEPARIPESLLSDKRQEKNIRQILLERLPKDIVSLLQLAGQTGQELDVAVYAVGGFVRDMLLGIPNDDIDLVVEGDGIAFAQDLGRKLGARVRPHLKFRTAVLILPGGQKIDVATARLEYYEYPAALPIVELSSLKMDLYRRDFSINTLAIHLCPPHFGRLVDFFGGQQDIKDGIIRVLHSLSFVEDPTRIIRAIRFEQRFQFKIGGQTERLIKNAVRLNIFQKLSGARIRHELRLLAEDSAPLDAFIRMRDLGLLQEIHPLLHFPQTKEALLEEIERVITWYKLLFREEAPDIWIVYFLGLVSGFDTHQVQALTSRLRFPPKRIELVESTRRQLRYVAMQLAQWGKNEGSAADLYDILSPLSLEGLLYTMAKQRKLELKKAVSHYLTHLQDVGILVTGSDIKKMGLEPGPRFANILRAVKRAVLNGEVRTREDQLKYARRMAASLQGQEPKAVS